MQEYKSRLPNLDSLITFDAVARHQSFTLAANELCLTQPAVSQRIKLLEQEMGIQLFERFHKSIRLSAQGNEYHNSVVVALNHLVAASEAVKTTSNNSTVKIMADIAMSSCWFVPQLTQLKNEFNNISFDLISTDNPQRYLDPSIDISIVHGEGEWLGYKSVLLFEEEVVPVCSQSYLDENGPINTIEDLVRTKLIDLIYEKWTWMNWAIWLSESNAPHYDINRAFRSNLYDATILAAKNGVGVALGWRYLVEPDLLDGSLIMPIAESVKTSNGYYLLIDERSPNLEQIEPIADWIRKKFQNQKIFK